MKKLLQAKLYFVRVISITIVLLCLIPGILMCAVAHGEIEQLIYIDKSISKEVIVDFVFDGDTIDEVHDKDGLMDKVRLLGINTPEMGDPDLGTINEPFAQAAKDFTFQLVGKTVTL